MDREPDYEDYPRAMRTRHTAAQPASRRGLLRATIGGGALIAVAGTGYAALRLGSSHGGPAAAAGISPGASSGAPSGLGTAPAPSASASANVSTSPGFDPSSLSGPYVYTRDSSPARTVVSTESGTQVAVLTDGARTVCFSGPTRTFAEPATTTATVTTDSWVRLAPKAWSEGAQDAGWFAAWFPGQVGSTGPDLFGLYTQYTAGAPNQVNSQGVRFAGQARFGEAESSDGYQNPLGDLDDRADFYDYLGVAYDFPDGVGKPTAAWYGDLDCSGLIRILYGYRMGYPMLLGDGSSTTGGTLPRHSWSIASNGPGPWLFGQGAAAAPSTAELTPLQPGDVLFFAEGTVKTEIDHCGVYFGTDQYGRRRFLSSRMGADGPTFGDAEGMSVIGGTGIYSQDFRAARRI